MKLNFVARGLSINSKMKIRARSACVFVCICIIGALSVIYLMIGGPGVGDYLEPLEGDYFYFSDRRMIAKNPRSPKSPSIPSEILEFRHGQGYIIARRKGYPYALDTAVDYWILDTREHRVFGPMDARDYARTRERLKIPDKIVFERRP